ncbi:hypothetical protein [Schinkia azotoformans]|uniref:hypothetical protein n=1 Tax=Schinkia azotoformans TaxID=1454 RepID=UPI002DBB72BA|nr:hypothetical protein [Schinkia azotoformans]MEC1716606.1 hypothetical protein [Schinkia azotoformans]MEC1739444.1 hypothetical protein [Schinkia azotoformans]MEC1745486.1 hypothetical protein [Schinkia azotoformans]MEC1756549.1 hypothetical protein [Schinkia azotoformans]MEC1765816.1 hypothetical protein [Schinkia azotoformans]
MAAIKENAKVTAEMVKEAVGSTKPSSPTFSKSQIVKSKKYAARRDALNALLEDNEIYSISQVDEVLNKFDKGGEK